MKTKTSIFSLLAFIALGLNLHAATPAPLPGLMSQEQLNQWNTAKANGGGTFAGERTAAQFYTGKPYEAEAGGYVFKYRTYNPEMSRWTSTDPSGFPDGPNGNVYAPNPTAELDSTGLDVTVDHPAGNPKTATGTYNGTNYTVTVTDITVSPVSAASITQLNTIYHADGITFQNNPGNVTVSVLDYRAAIDTSSGIGGLSIDVKVGPGYNFTQNVVSNIVPQGGTAGQAYGDVHTSGTAISRASTPGGTVGDVGGGEWQDTPYRQLSSVTHTTPVTWTGSLYIVQVSGSTYTVVGMLTYGFTISE